MTYDTQIATLLLNLGNDATSDEVSELTTQLLHALSRSDAESVEKLRPETIEDGSKGDPITLGTIALALSVAAAPEIIRLISTWLNRRSTQTISLKIKLGDDEMEFSTAATASPSEVEKLADRFAAMLKKYKSETGNG